MRPLAILPLLVACGAPLSASGPPGVDPFGALGGRSVTALRVEAEGMDTDRLAAMLVTREGRALTSADVAEDTRRLWALEAFDDVRVHAEPDGAGVRVRFELVLRPRIAAAAVRGDPTEPRLADIFRMLAGGIYDAARVRRVALAVRDRYRRRGHLHAEAEVRAERSGGAVELALTLHVGPRHRVASITFDGAERVSEVELRGCLRTRDGGVNAPSGIWRPDLFEADRACIAGLYYDRGMVQFEAGEPALELDDAAGTVAVRVAIREGPVFRIGRVELEDDGGRLSAPLADFDPPRAGEVFSRVRMQELMQRLRAASGAEVEPRVALDEDAGQVGVRLVVGPREGVLDERLDEELSALGSSPGQASPGLASPGLASPGLASPGLASPGLASPGLASPGLAPGQVGGGTGLRCDLCAEGAGAGP